MERITKLAELFRKFPGIGPRQAKRFVYFLLGEDPAYVEELSRQIRTLQDEMRMCGGCHRFFPLGRTNEGSCLICRDPGRDKSILMVVAKDIDFETIEKSRTYSGMYFVLGGTVPVLDKEPEKHVRSKELARHIEMHPEIKEVVLAMNTTTEGEHTADYVRQAIAPLVKKHSLTVSILGRGLSTGAELEYADSETLKSAFQNRR